MKKTIKMWFVKQKKDIKILAIAYIIGFIYTLLTTTGGFYSIFMGGFAFMLFAAILINVYRYWKKWSSQIIKDKYYKQHSEPKDTEPKQ